MHKNKTVLINIPGGATSRVKPLHVVSNKQVKNYVRGLFTNKWDAEVWGKIKKQPGMIKHSFLKRELPNNLNESENDQIKIRWIEYHKMPSPEREFTPLENGKAGGSKAIWEMEI